MILVTVVLRQGLCSLTQPPAFALLISIPAFSVDFVAVFQSDGWSLIALDRALAEDAGLLERRWGFQGHREEPATQLPSKPYLRRSAEQAPKYAEGI